MAARRFDWRIAYVASQLAMKLGDILGDLGKARAHDGATQVSGITADSRAVKPGDLFVAIPGTKTDGLAYVAQAVANGAVAVVAERAPAMPLPDGVAFVQVENVRRALALAAARMFPRQPAVIAAVTGTSGKTSVAHFLRQIWALLGHKAAYIGTLGVILPDGATYGGLTTPDPVTLHRLLDEMAGEGVTHVAVEASSHGLDQFRLDGLRLRAAAFTNLSRDHLDYHPTMAAYLAAKLRLFKELLPADGAVVTELRDRNSDGVAEVLATARQRGLKTFTTVAFPGWPLPQGGDLRATIIMHGYRQLLQFDPPFAGCTSLTLPLAGFFQASNALTAAGLAIACGDEPGVTLDALTELKGVPGRLELVGDKNGAGVFVDYAHKPDALGTAIWALRPFLEDDETNRLIVVFGAGGDRDPGKRVLMGEIAQERADVVVITDDNPRSENPAAIRRAILQGAPGAIEIADRGEAIRWAINELRPGDILLIAGKGHETGQIVGDRVLPFSDREVARAALQGQAS